MITAMHTAEYIRDLLKIELPKPQTHSILEGFEWVTTEEVRIDINKYPHIFINPSTPTYSEWGVGSLNQLEQQQITIDIICRGSDKIEFNDSSVDKYKYLEEDGKKYIRGNQVVDLLLSSSLNVIRENHDSHISEGYHSVRPESSSYQRLDNDLYHARIVINANIQQ